ncbi:MAG: GGDEF domain-containing protein [Uliginosibacterium sp.]|nr:GGDEF domain-containing protein [Uliginosibacterium sp.]
MLYLDLDGFERINDEYGRMTGDQILIAAAQRLKTTTRGGDFVARQEEDEFVIVFSCDPDDREIGRYAARLIEALEIPCRQGSRRHSVREHWCGKFPCRRSDRR